MRRDNPWMIAIVSAIVSGLIVGVIVSEIYEHKEEELLKIQIDSSVQNAENLLNIGLNEEAIKILEGTLELFFTEAIP
jgi:RsiW-degrading membrane proteinase PrsW (M82 family)